MLEKLLQATCLALFILGGAYVGASFVQLNNLAARVTTLEEAGTSWDITIVRPVAE